MKSYLCVYLKDGSQSFWEVPIKSSHGKPELASFESKLSDLSAEGAELLFTGTLEPAELETIRIIEKVKLKVDKS